MSTSPVIAGGDAVTARAHKTDAPGPPAAGPPEVAGNPEPTLRHIVGRVDRALRNELDGRLNGLGLTTAGYTMLFVLRRLPDLSNADLARRAGVTPQATNLTVLALTERGLIQRRPSRDNNRILKNRLTARGQRMIEHCEAEAGDVESSMLAGFSAAERDQFEQLLRRSAGNLGIHI